MASSSSSSSVRAEVAGLSSRGMEDLARGKRGSGPVRRNLFGPVDHQQLQQDFQKLLVMSMEAARKRWDFDFHADRPAQGSGVEWEELKCQDVPAFYRSCIRGKRGVVLVEEAPGAEQQKMMMSLVAKPAGAASPSSSSSGDEYLEVTTRGSYRIQKRTVCLRASKRRQATITDFYSVKRKRLLNHKAPTRL